VLLEAGDPTDAERPAVAHLVDLEDDGQPRSSGAEEVPMERVHRVRGIDGVDGGDHGLTGDETTEGPLHARRRGAPEVAARLGLPDGERLGEGCHDLFSIRYTCK